MKTRKSAAPKPQTMKSTPRNSAERKTARPNRSGPKMDTPRVAVAPEPLARKRSPRT
jgi:hypothetical protein